METRSLFDKASLQTSFSGLSELKNQARKNDPEALEVTAQQFEGLYIHMMLKSMRQANEVFRESSLFNSNEMKFYEQMFDQQISAALSQRKALGIADEIIKQIQ